MANSSVISRLPDSSSLSNPAQQSINTTIRQIQTSDQQSSSQQAAASVTILSGSHSTRLGSPAAMQSANSLFVETDRHYLYASQGNSWIFVTGLMTGASSARPSDLLQADVGAQFAAVSGSSYTLYIWSGSAWLTHS